MMGAISDAELMFRVCACVRQSVLVVFTVSSYLMARCTKEADMDNQRLVNELLLLLVYCLMINSLWTLCTIYKTRSMCMHPYKWIVCQVMFDILPGCVMADLLYKTELVEMYLSMEFVVMNMSTLVVYAALLFFVQMPLLFCMRKQTTSPNLKIDESAAMLRKKKQFVM